MSENLTELTYIISEELGLFNHILNLEQEKSDAIINKNGMLLEKLSREQEKYLEKIDPIETVRKQIAGHYSGSSDYDATLKDIAIQEGEDDSLLVKKGTELKRTLEKIKSCQSTNLRMINDNLEFFSRMMNELKEQAMPETGYGRDGAEKGNKVNPLLLDKKI
ncbi:MAG: flagellar protein FlgN [Spirochaetes bacterium]|nr:flagellar protein FlgN [Spirochaetota bacterium]